MKKLTCRLCHSDALAAVADLNPMPLVDAYTRAPNAQPLHPLGLQMCRECGHIQLSEVIAPELLFQSDYLFQTADYPWLVEHYRKYAEEVSAEFNPRFVLEIGSNDGTLAAMFEARGAQVLGVDPSSVPASVQTLRERFTPKTAEEIVFAHGQPDLVIANHVFAHNDDLEEIVRGLKLLLAPHGVFIFETNCGLDLLEKHLFDIVYHEHMDYHTVSPLVRFFARLGLEFFRVEHNDSKGGTLRGYVSHAGARGVEPSVQQTMDLEEACGATQPGIFTEWNERLEQRRRRVQEQLSDADVVAGYGAAAGGIATLYHMGLEHRLSWIVDDSPRRWGMYAPHCNIIVREPTSLYQPLDPWSTVLQSGLKIIVLSWRYAEVIKAKHPQLKIIVP